MKGILKAKGRSISVPGDALSSNALACKFHGQSGLPQAADSIAYDPVQKLIAVSLSSRIGEAPVMYRSLSSLTSLKAGRYDTSRIAR